MGKDSKTIKQLLHIESFDLYSPTSDEENCIHLCLTLQKSDIKNNLFNRLIKDGSHKDGVFFIGGKNNSVFCAFPEDSSNYLVPYHTVEIGHVKTDPSKIFNEEDFVLFVEFLTEDDFKSIKRVRQLDSFLQRLRERISK